MEAGGHLALGQPGSVRVSGRPAAAGPHNGARRVAFVSVGTSVAPELRCRLEDPREGGLAAVTHKGGMDGSGCGGRGQVREEEPTFALNFLLTRTSRSQGPGRRVLLGGLLALPAERSSV